MKIPLTKGFFAEIDERDAPVVLRHKWHVLCRTPTLKYAARAPRTGKTIYLHSEILKSSDRIDHADGNGLNCTRANLRFATRSQNKANSGPQKNNTSGYKRVSWEKGVGKWRAKIKVNGRQIHLGLFDDPAEAAKAYDRAALEHFGAFARFNFPRTVL